MKFPEGSQNAVLRLMYAIELRLQGCPPNFFCAPRTKWHPDPGTGRAHDICAFALFANRYGVLPGAGVRPARLATPSAHRGLLGSPLLAFDLNTSDNCVRPTAICAPTN
jgi:hypothetical protein